MTRNLNCSSDFNSQPSADINTLAKHAQEARSKLAKFSEALARELDINPHFGVQIGPQKKQSRILEKAENKHNGDLSKIKDFSRNRLLFSNNNQFTTLRSMSNAGRGNHPFLETWKDRGIEIIGEPDDAFLNRKKSGWVGMNLSVKVKLRNGDFHICELQVIPEGMLKADKDTHHRYEHFIRPITDFAEADRRDLTQEERTAIQPHIDKNRETFNIAIAQTDTAELLSPEERITFHKEMTEYHEARADHHRAEQSVNQKANRRTIALAMT